jgi:tetratricopeptide (TPR) repeat protein
MDTYADAETLVRSGDPERVEEGIARLRARTEASPEDAEAWYRYGSALDYSDREEQAIGAYERVFAIGLDRLDPELRPRLYVQAGSTLRNLDRLDEARALLEQGRAAFPSNRAIVAFLALVEVSAGNERRAVDLLFEAILADGAGDDSVATFHRALTYYAGELASGSPGRA